MTIDQYLLPEYAAAPAPELPVVPDMPGRSRLHARRRPGLTERAALDQGPPGDPADRDARRGEHRAGGSRARYTVK